MPEAQERELTNQEVNKNITEISASERFEQIRNESWKRMTEIGNAIRQRITDPNPFRINWNGELTELDSLTREAQQLTNNSARELHVSIDSAAETQYNKPFEFRSGIEANLVLSHGKRNDEIQQQQNALERQDVQYLHTNMEKAVTDLLLLVDFEKIDALDFTQKRGLQISKDILYRNMLDLLTVPAEQWEYQSLKHELVNLQFCSETFRQAGVLKETPTDIGTPEVELKELNELLEKLPGSMETVMGVCQTYKAIHTAEGMPLRLVPYVQEELVKFGEVFGGGQVFSELFGGKDRTLSTFITSVRANLADNQQTQPQQMLLAAFHRHVSDKLDKLRIAGLYPQTSATREKFLQRERDGKKKIEIPIDDTIGKGSKKGKKLKEFIKKYIPTPFLKDLKKINIKPEDTQIQLNTLDEKLSGEYRQDTQEIDLIYLSHPQFSEEETVAHELGHHAHTYRLSVDEILDIYHATEADRSSNNNPLSSYIVSIEASNFQNSFENKGSYNVDVEKIAIAFEQFFHTPHYLHVVAPETYKVMLDLATSRVDPMHQKEYRRDVESEVAYYHRQWRREGKTEDVIRKEYYQEMEQARLSRIRNYQEAKAVP
ncbi:MAG TPA: hypothetical protein VLG12_07600 [Candidatus Saccharimonadales bacterium]|nr:hypothetical protein [Candidatus Saccharimonadales bacterium]